MQIPPSSGPLDSKWLNQSAATYVDDIAAAFMALSVSHPGAETLPIEERLKDALSKMDNGPKKEAVQRALEGLQARDYGNEKLALSILHDQVSGNEFEGYKDEFNLIDLYQNIHNFVRGEGAFRQRNIDTYYSLRDAVNQLLEKKPEFLNASDINQLKDLQKLLQTDYPKFDPNNQDDALEAITALWQKVDAFDLDFLDQAFNRQFGLR